MKLKDINKDLIENYFTSGKTVLYIKLIPYKNNTAIKVYDEENQPIGDIPEDEISNYINKDKDVLFIEQAFDDETGLFNYEVKTMI